MNFKDLKAHVDFLSNDFILTNLAELEEEYPFDITSCQEHFQTEKEFEDRLAEYSSLREKLYFIEGVCRTGQDKTAKIQKLERVVKRMAEKIAGEFGYTVEETISAFSEDE